MIRRTAMVKRVRRFLMAATAGRALLAMGGCEEEGAPGVVVPGEESLGDPVAAPADMEKSEGSTASDFTVPVPDIPSVAELPEPVAELPGPVAELPEPVAERPKPETEWPKPVAEKPKPERKRGRPERKKEEPAAADERAKLAKRITSEIKRNLGRSRNAEALKAFSVKLDTALTGTLSAEQIATFKKGLPNFDDPALAEKLKGKGWRKLRQTVSKQVDTLADPTKYDLTNDQIQELSKAVSKAFARKRGGSRRKPRSGAGEKKSRTRKRDGAKKPAAAPDKKPKEPKEPEEPEDLPTVGEPEDLPEPGEPAIPAMPVLPSVPEVPGVPEVPAIP